MTFLLRPLKYKRPVSSASAMSPVRNHPSDCATAWLWPLWRYAFATPSPRTRISPFSSTRTSIPGKTRPIEPWSVRKSLYLLGKRRSVRNERPEFPTEAGMEAAEPPPAPEKVFLFRALEIFTKLLGEAVAFHFALELALEGFDKPGHRHEN